MKRLILLSIIAAFMAIVCIESASAHTQIDARTMASAIVQFTPSEHHELSKVDHKNHRYLVGNIEGVSKGKRPINIIQPAGAMIRDLERDTTYTLALGETQNKGEYIIIAILGQNREIGASLK